MARASTTRTIAFEHDGHRFEAEEQQAPAKRAAEEPQVRWCVTMDGAQVLEFHGPFPYRDADVRKRVLEWYEIQKPR